jgi:PAS domain S-box-containing protein
MLTLRRCVSVLAAEGRRRRPSAFLATGDKTLADGHTVGMTTTAGGLAVGGDVERALAGIPVPSYVLDTAGIVRWINPAAERLLGDVRGRHFTSVVGAEDRARAQELFARKVLGTAEATETSAVLVSTDGTRLALEISAVPLMGGEFVVGVFGLLTATPDEEASTPPAHLTPRQAEVLRLLEQGRSTKQIAQELHLSTETVRNHVRHLLRALGVNTRLEAVAAARRSQASAAHAT